MTSRTYSSRRKNIVDALVTKLKTINGQGAFLTDVGENVHPRLKFWDEVDEFPAIHLNAGSETREYRAAHVRDRFLSITIRMYDSIWKKMAIFGLFQCLMDLVFHRQRMHQK